MSAQKMGDREFLAKILVGVEGIGDDAGPYPADEQLQLVVEDVTLSAAAVQRFLKEYVRERAGN
jgi:hypothetical protein